jgi:hypothetical protein
MPIARILVPTHRKQGVTPVETCATPTIPVWHMASFSTFRTLPAYFVLDIQTLGIV